MEIHPEGKPIDVLVIKESQNIQNINIKRKKISLNICKKKKSSLFKATILSFFLCYLSRCRRAANKKKMKFRVWFH